MAFLAKIPAPLIGCVVLVAVWLAMGAVGYRNGNVVQVGETQVDPEFVRLLASVLAAALASGVAKLPYVDLVRGLLVQLGFVGGLSAVEERDQYERIKWLSQAKPVDPAPGPPAPPAEGGAA